MRVFNSSGGSGLDRNKGRWKENVWVQRLHFFHRRLHVGKIILVAVRLTYTVMTLSRGSGGRPTVSCL